jgi:hypothetical protein
MMPVVLVALVVAIPAGLFVLLARRLSRDLRLVAIAAAFGAIAFVPAELAERWVLAWAGLHEHAEGRLDFSAIVYAFLVAAPLEQGLKAFALYPLWKRRRLETALDRVVIAAAVATGFVCAHNALHSIEHGPSGLTLARGLLAAPAHAFCAGMWGYAVSRNPTGRFAGRSFNATWLFAMLFNGIYDHIAFGRTELALVATAPILLGMSLVAFTSLRDFARRERGEDAPRQTRFSIAPPSIGAVRAALRRTERPVMLGWIAGGALVTLGVLTAALAAAVALGRRAGLDFAAVDRGDSAGAAAVGPLLLLGAAALLSFLLAGYLVARASASRSVLEPAIAAALAIAGCLILLGLAAPVAVVFAVAFAPIAFGLSCAGAWVGMSR